MLRYLVEQLVLECFGKSAYMMLACSSVSTTLAEGVRLGLVTPEEMESERIRYGNLWNYVGD